MRERMPRSGHVAGLVLLGAAALTGQATAQGPSLSNASFEEGTHSPTHWTLSGTGRYHKLGGAEGNRWVSVAGTGEDSGAWFSEAVELAPSSTYRVSFYARNVDGSGGTPTSGPTFCNRDLGALPPEWTYYESFFFTPRRLDPASCRLRFGQWHMKGSVGFDGVGLVPVQPVYRRTGMLQLGQGERISGREYSFCAPFAGTVGNCSRPLAYHQCGFNTNRWTFEAGSEVVYRHDIESCRQVSAAAELSVSWYVAGELVVSASADGNKWVELGRLSGLATRTFEIPQALFPVDAVWVRLAARPSAGAPGCALQVNSYTYTATLDRELPEVVGATHFAAVTTSDPRLKVTLEDIGEARPGGSNAAKLRVQNPTGRNLRSRGTVSAGRQTNTAELVIAPGESLLSIPYELNDTGRLRMRISLSGDVLFEAELKLWVPELYSIAYGQRLPASGPVELWWASSGWKVSRERPAPKAKGEAISISAAKGETEAAQLIIRPLKPLRALKATPSPLEGPKGSRIPAERIELLRVRYVNVVIPTDETGTAASWPDPLPPLGGPIDLEPGVNHPLWVRVSVPRGVPAGTYTGSIRLAAEGLELHAPLRVHVYDFTLPERMTCTTAFGFSPWEVWRYQKLVEPAQRRAVLEKYWADFSAHHISPYDPAPLDPISVRWPGLANWEGGIRDPSEKHSGKASLRVEDASTTSQISASYVPLIPIPRGGLRLSLHFKAAAGHRFIVTLGHYDENGSWMRGRNLDMELIGVGDWKRFERTVMEFPPGSSHVKLVLWAAVWKDDGSPVGTVWYDDVSLQDALTGQELLDGGDFEPVGPEALAPRFDWSGWDRAMEEAIGRWGFNSFMVHIPGLGGGTFHSRTEPTLLGFREDSPEYRAAFANYCRALEDHLRQKGWLELAYVYWFDEPEPKDYEFVMNGFRKLKAAAPGLNRMLTEQVEPALIGGPNIWCPLTSEYDHAKAEERRRHGEKFWWYVCTAPKAPYCGLFIDRPATEMRIWLWQTWQHKIDGILVWQTNYWTSDAAYPDPARPQNPYTDPMSWVSGYSASAGTKQPWGNGDGRFIYPPEAAAGACPPGPVLDGPVDSIRWEMLRDGIEDYEYLAILRRLIEKQKDTLNPEELRRLRGLLEVPRTITDGLTNFAKDPAPIEARREELARAIEALLSKGRPAH